MKYQDNHDEKRNIMAATFDFYSCVQKPGQSFADWKVELCDKMNHCGFTSSLRKERPQDRGLRDMYIIGINSAKIRQALLKEQDPDLATAEKIIHTAERLQPDIRHFGGTTNGEDAYVAAVPWKKNGKGHNWQRNLATRKSQQAACQCYGSVQDVRTDYRFKEAVCHFCKRRGHIERVCRDQKSGRATTNKIETVHVNHVNETEAHKDTSTRLSLGINGHDCSFEIDTSADCTIINSQEWKRLGSPAIHSSAFKLKCYSGKTLEVLGERTVLAAYDGKFVPLSMVVVKGERMSLLGLQGIRQLRVDLTRIILGDGHFSRPISKLYSEVKVQSLLQSIRKYSTNHWAIAQRYRHT